MHEGKFNFYGYKNFLDHQYGEEFVEYDEKNHELSVSVEDGNKEYLVKVDEMT